MGASAVRHADVLKTSVTFLKVKSSPPKKF